MMRPLIIPSVLMVVLMSAPASRAEAPFDVDQQKVAVPEGFDESIRKLMPEEAYQLSADGKVVATIWIRDEVPALAATSRQFRTKRLDYRAVSHSEMVGVIQIDQIWSDFRKQRIKPGLYTLRVGFQPQDGDHMGTAPFNDFLLLLPAAKDTDPELIDVREMHEISGVAVGGTHPGVMLMFPNSKPEEKPSLVDQGDDIWTLNFARQGVADTNKATLGFALVVSGHSASE